MNRRQQKISEKLTYKKIDTTKKLSKPKLISNTTHSQHTLRSPQK